jgi:ATP synthase protein I
VEDISKITNRDKEKLRLEIDESGRILTKKPFNKQKINQSRESWIVLGYVGQIGFTVAIPIVIGAVAGSRLDVYSHSYPKFTLGLLILGIIVSLIGFVGTIVDIIKDLKH